ncbi:MAG: flagellin [Bryobacteraceae bacterium]
MIKGLDSIGERFLADLSRVEERSRKVQNQISSGYRASRVSDEPQNVVNILHLRSRVEHATTISSNLTRVKAEVDTAEAAVRLAVKLVERANTLGVQTANGVAVNRNLIAIEVRQIHEQLVSFSNTSSEGRLVFSGDLDQTSLYSLDLTQPGGVNRVAVATNTRQIEDVKGTRFSVSKSVHELFDIRDSLDVPTTDNVFVALTELATAMEADDPVAVEAALPKIAAALDTLNRNLTFYGQAQNRVTNAIDETGNASVALRTELGAAQDTDLAAALVELNLTRVHQEAALGAHSRLPKTSLFDYLG